MTTTASGARGAMRIPAHTIESQRRAADPTLSAWVSANAGSGKTKVLTDRVMRLMLAGTPPGRILCLTFTKAAAANMSIRIFDTLSAWVSLDDAALTKRLEALDGAHPSRERLVAARRLFARAVETPGGLKIETIHAFCERLLHIAPFEANVPASFTVLDDAASDELVRAAKAGILAAAHLGDAALADAFAAVDAHASGERLDALLREALACKDALADAASREAALAKVAEIFGLEPHEDEATIAASMLADALPQSERAALARAFLATGSSNDAKQAACLQRMAEATDDPSRLEAYLGLFLRKDGAPKADSTLATKAMGTAVKERLIAERQRLVALGERRRAAAALARTRALYVLAGAILEKVEAEKRRLGALDFDDLVRRTLALLRRGEAAWLLYKLDRGIDHVLVDEAQDTNPEQWEILRHITEEFHAGAGAAGGRPRTIFAVGDPKQSIYSFQGADPRRFEESRQHWRKLAHAGGFPFEEVPLTVSFRSAPTILSAVDRVFGVPAHYAGLDPSDRATGTVHESVRPDTPGLVELWPIARPDPGAEPDAWTHPVDVVEESAPAVVTARRVARAIRVWTTTGDACGRVRRPGEVLVLVRKRNAAFHAVIKALKDTGLPVAGADRLSLTHHIAVEDLIAAGRTALLPQDDLTVAAALKSPLVALEDDDLVRIAARRGPQASVADAVRAAAEAGDAAAIRAREALDAWARLAAAHGPFGFYAALVGPRGGRRALVSRLGSEAGDAIDAFLGLAREAEAPEAPSLARFLAGFEGVEREIKRDLESGADEVRVMTVHGAKGLEAPVVVVLDDAGAQAGRVSPLVALTVARDETLPVWSPGKDHDCDALGEARDLATIRNAEEANRLLYVALTRAESHLVVAPYINRADRDAPETAWSSMTRLALAGTPGPIETDLPYVAGALVWRENATDATGEPPADPVREERGTAAGASAPPAWLFAPAAPEREAAPPLRPSNALSAADRRPRAADKPFVAAARLRGTLIHALVERLPALPADTREAAATSFVAARARGLSEEVRAAIVRDACAVIADPRLAPLFSQHAFAEAPVAGRVVLPSGEEIAVAGQLDRLAIGPDAIVFADFKTAARPPAPDAPVPGTTLVQMGLYAALLARAFPGRRIEAHLVWTAGPHVRVLTQPELDAGLARAMERRDAAAGR
ncbi:double-strand break repair helicase AddA [Salinarimonas ramus]|uniref:DNA 3'-5' helicase n=1 Tax=Salinarimonas ramus TaxID=690164 RepID=A0A917QAQ5_9HYPH|nr:double-strand break repair helicase AddA [Salinarimonas ramus]GGK39366.1 double-strand break repair helicase AddA [Salinarimonas ramus]